MSSGISEPRTETSTQQTGSKLRDGERRLMELDSGPEIQPNAAAGLQLQQRASAVERAGAEEERRVVLSLTERCLRCADEAKELPLVVFHCGLFKRTKCSQHSGSPM